MHVCTKIVADLKSLILTGEKEWAGTHAKKD